MKGIHLSGFIFLTYSFETQWIYREPNTYYSKVANRNFNSCIILGRLLRGCYSVKLKTVLPMKIQEWKHFFPTKIYSLPQYESFPTKLIFYHSVPTMSSPIDQSLPDAFARFDGLCFCWISQSDINAIFFSKSIVFVGFASQRTL